jgi:cysteinyl-tRNA synthetase
LQAKGFTGREVRYLLLTAHYRETFNFTLEGLAGAKTALARIDECVGKLRELAGSETGYPADPVSITPFIAALSDDLNISEAWACVFDWVRATNRKLADNIFTPQRAAIALTTWEKMDSILGVGVNTETEIPAEILALAEARAEAKKAKDFKRADAIRDELKAKGWVIEDSPKGIKLKKL